MAAFALAPTVAAALAPPYRLAWRVDTDAPTSGLAVAEDLALGVTADAVVAVDLAEGRLAWTVARSGGPLLRPAVARVAGRPLLVFTESAERGATSTSGADPADVVGLDLGDRSERWRVRFDAGIPAPVTLADGLAYVVDGDGVLTALDLANGDERWTADAAGASDAPPALAGDVLLVAGRPEDAPARLAALDAASGAPVWGDTVASAIPAGSAIAADRDDVVVAGADRLLRVLDPATGRERWNALLVNVPSPVGAPLVAEGAVYMADYAGGVYRFDLATGERAWDQQLNRLVVRSSPVAAGDAIVIGTNDGHLVALDRSNGHVVVDRATGPGLLGPIAIAGDLVIVPKSGGDPGVLAFATDPEGRRLDVASPTALDLVGSLGRFVVAFAIVAFGVAILPGGLARRFLPTGRRRRADEGAP